MIYPQESRRISPVELSLGAGWFGNRRVDQAAVLVSSSGTLSPIITEIRLVEQGVREKLSQSLRLVQIKRARQPSGVGISGGRPNGAANREYRLTVRSGGSIRLSLMAAAQLGRATALGEQGLGAAHGPATGGTRDEGWGGGRGGLRRGLNQVRWRGRASWAE